MTTTATRDLHARARNATRVAGAISLHTHDGHGLVPTRCITDHHDNGLGQTICIYAHDVTAAHRRRAPTLTAAAAPRLLDYLTRSTATDTL